ncbi:hypothetical protein [Streptomyces sp. NPDC089795]|uniref:hypothetical protein n=1 Tax=Streptomyces sp. NPDC089795 TaxID=3155297 RepID=UPI00342E40EA
MTDPRCPTPHPAALEGKVCDKGKGAFHCGSDLHALPELARSLHGAEIGATWSVLTPDSWVGHVRRDGAPADPAPFDGEPEDS